MKNEYRIIGNVVEITLKNGERCLIDLDDLEKVDKAINSFWYMDANGYVLGGTPSIKIHRFIMDTPSGLVVDHKNHLKWDNRKENLVNCTNSENAKNQLTYAELIAIGVKDAPPKIETKLAKGAEVMEFLNINRQTLHYYRTKKGLPHIRLNGRTIRYDLNAINAWLESQKEVK